MAVSTMPEHVRCYACGADDADRLWPARDRLHDLPGQFGWVRCRRCRLVYLDPRPTREELPTYYPSDYRPYGAGPLGPLARLRERWGHAKKLAVLPPPSGWLLDVGCGAGGFLAAARARGWQVVGVEPGEEPAARARRRYGIFVHTGRLETAPFAEGSFAVVTLWHVFEHLDDPAGTLAAAHRLLRPGGEIIIGLPHTESWLARWFGPTWVGLEAPRHFHLFSPALLRQALRAAGFEPRWQRCHFGEYDAVRVSCWFWLQDRSLSPRLRRLLQRGVDNLATRALLAPYCRVAERRGRASVITIGATRPH